MTDAVIARSWPAPAGTVLDDERCYAEGYGGMRLGRAWVQWRRANGPMAGFACISPLPALRETDEVLGE